jgi:hypothetical protein
MTKQIIAFGNFAKAPDNELKLKFIVKYIHTRVRGPYLNTVSQSVVWLEQYTVEIIRSYALASLKRVYVYQNCAVLHNLLQIPCQRKSDKVANTVFSIQLRCSEHTRYRSLIYIKAWILNQLVHVINLSISIDSNFALCVVISFIYN